MAVQALLACSVGLRRGIRADTLALVAAVVQRPSGVGPWRSAVGVILSLGHGALVMGCACGTIAGVQVGGVGLVHAARISGALAPCVGAIILVGLGGERLCGCCFRVFAAAGTPTSVLLIGALSALDLDCAMEVSLLATYVLEMRSLPAAFALAPPLLFILGMALSGSVGAMLLLGVYEWSTDYSPPTRRRCCACLDALSAAFAIFAALALVAENAATWPDLADSTRLQWAAQRTKARLEALGVATAAALLALNCTMVVVTPLLACASSCRRRPLVGPRAEALQQPLMTAPGPDGLEPPHAGPEAPR